MKHETSLLLVEWSCILQLAFAKISIRCLCGLCCWLWHLWSELPDSQLLVAERGQDGCCVAADVSSFLSGSPGRLHICGISPLLAISTRNRQRQLAPLPTLHARADLPWANSSRGSWGRLGSGPTVMLKFTDQRWCGLHREVMFG